MNTSPSPAQPAPFDIYQGPPARSDRSAFAAYVCAVMQAWAEGKVIEVRDADNPLAHWTSIDPSWNWVQRHYRVSPSCRPKRTVPWEGPQDVPVGALFGIDQQGAMYAPCRISRTGVHLIAVIDTPVFYCWAVLADQWRYTLDHGRTFHACVKEIGVS